ncbi:MAG: response regulator, partial [Myxococcales bacterium]|nr:response regulator [Myxococcales bacterium]
SPAARRVGVSLLPGAPPETLLSVLVADSPESFDQIRAILKPDRFELIHVSEIEATYARARSTAPDLILLDAAQALAPEAEVIAQLRADPLTDFLPIVLLRPERMALDPATIREAGADEGLVKPVDGPALVRAAGRLVGLDAEEEQALEALGDLTLSEVADRLSAELRRGIVEAADRGEEVKIPVGEGSEMLAAAWSTIARVRAHLAERSGGKVHFRDPVGPEGAALISMDDSIADEALPERSVPVQLQGRRVLIVDDDPAITWFFSGLLREVGAEVQEAEDGEAGLAAARRRRPDVILSDILMPKMDGLALCRELGRDPCLADVPVILLSWKDDFLQRMRELRSGARGYLRKEAGSGQILAKVEEVLQPLANLEQRLRAGGEVRGRLDGLGMLPLLHAVAAERPDARLTVRDAWNLFEMELRAGELLAITRTATDGSFSRGQPALLPLLGVSAGRYVVSDAEGEVRATIEGDLEVLLVEAAQQLGALVEAVSGGSLPRIAGVDLDQEILASYLSSCPEGIRLAVERLGHGSSPRELLLQGAASPRDLEAALVDLACRGVLLGVRGVGGEDPVGQALSRRAAQARGEIPAVPPVAPHEVFTAEVELVDPAIEPGAAAEAWAAPVAEGELREVHESISTEAAAAVEEDELSEIEAAAPGDIVQEPLEGEQAGPEIADAIADALEAAPEAGEAAPEASEAAPEIAVQEPAEESSDPEPLVQEEADTGRLSDADWLALPDYLTDSEPAGLREAP